MRPRNLAVAAILTGFVLAVAAMTPVLAGGFGNPDLPVSTSQSDSDSEDLDGMLEGVGSSKGTALGSVEFEERGGDGSTKIEIDVQAPELSGDTMHVTVNGIGLDGHMDLGDTGKGEMKLDTRDGDTVPELESGDKVVVRSAETGTVVLSGALG